MTDSRNPEPGSEAWWRGTLTDPKYHFGTMRRWFRHIPSGPHCKVCGAPFSGVGGLVMGPMGFRPWEKNPMMCRACISAMNRIPPGGAEISTTLLFADVRGSTGLAERSSATDFAALLRRFYAVGSQAIIEEDGVVDKFVGDEVVALFIPVYAGGHHAEHALRAAEQLLRETGHDRPEGPWLDVGIGIHTGIAFVGTVAVGGEVSDFTALGDTVNTAARLAAEAGPGEVLVSEEALANAGSPSVDLERRELTLRGRTAPIAVRVAMLDRLDQLTG